MIIPTAQAVLDKIAIDKDALVAHMLLQLREGKTDISALCIVLGLTVEELVTLKQGIDLDLFTATMLANRINSATGGLGAGGITGEQLLRAIRGSDYWTFVPKPFQALRKEQK